jgi:glyoxylase-like metal-dependent hydrolase (beta-lactamase superfamily II)
MRKLIVIALASAVCLVANSAFAQRQVDWSKVEIKTTDLGHNTYRLEGQGGNITVIVGTDGIIMVDGQFAPLHDKIKAAIAKISPLPIKYLINTHFHGDHTGGNEGFQKDGTIVVAQDNIRVRLTAGTTNGISGRKTPPAPAGAIPKQTYFGGSMTLEVGGRKVILHHVNNAHTDGDTWVHIPDANVIATGDTSNNTKKYQTIDFANGGDIRGMIRANSIYLGVGNSDTKYVVGHGPLAKRSDIAEFLAMLVTARQRIEPLFRQGKSEDEVVKMRPLKELDAKWSSSEQQAVGFTRMVYNSFKRS